MKGFGFASHAIALAAGACLWCLLPNDPRPLDAAETGLPNSRSRSAAALSAALDSRLTRLKLQEKRRQDRITQTTVREVALEEIRVRPERDRQNLETLARILSIAESFNVTEDLRPALYAALVAEDTEQARGIFLAWHRRDPAGAFDELARRPAWFSQFSRDPVLLYGLDPDEIISQLNHPNRSDAFRNNLNRLLAEHLASQDNLATLVNLWNTLDDHLRNDAVERFAKWWVPDNGKMAADFILHDMPEDLRGKFFENLLHGIPNPNFGWTDDFSKALLLQPLGEFEPLRNHMESEADRIDNTLGDSFYFPRGDANARFAPRESERDNGSAMNRGVEAFLRHRQDYPQLLADGLIDLDQIRIAMIEEMPAAADFGELLDAALIQGLLLYNPSQVIHWASARIPPEKLANLCAEQLQKRKDPRASKTLELLEAIPPALAEHSPKLAEKRMNLQAQVDRWRTWDPAEGNSR